ncbi:MAG: tetratricopeptide repeat protein [Cyanobacteria bacterium P01_H01_bin.74]
MPLKYQKLVFAGFSLPGGKTIDTTTALAHFEKLFSFSLIRLFEMLTPLIVRDRAINDRILIEMHADDTETKKHKRYQSICQNHRSDYLLFGDIDCDEQDNHSVSVTLCLYDNKQGKLIEIVKISQEALFSVKAETTLQSSYFNQLVSQAMASCLKGLNLASENQPEKIPALCQSVSVLELLYTAYTKKSSLERVELYSEALRQEEPVELAYLELAKTFKNLNDYQKSILYYREALKYSKGSSHHKSKMAAEAGISCAMLGNAVLSIKWWEKAIEYDNTFILPYLNISTVYEDQGAYSKAIDHLCTAQALDDADFRTVFSLARLYSKTGEWEKALSQYQRQLETEGNDPWCHSDLATCYLNLGNIDSARQHLEKTLQIDPEGEAGEFAKLILVGITE